MKKEQREVYIVLAEAVDFTLCGFCKYASSIGCCESPNCNHPLDDRVGFSDREYGLCPGDDCWGFRPQFGVSLTTDIVGIILANGWDFVSWGENKEGQLVVTGRAVRG